MNNLKIIIKKSYFLYINYLLKYDYIMVNFGMRFSEDKFVGN